jgi:hypothetical protein
VLNEMRTSSKRHFIDGVADALKIWIRAIVGHLHKALMCGFESLRISGLQVFRDDLFRRVFMRRRVMNALDETLKEARVFPLKRSEVSITSCG